MEFIEKAREKHKDVAYIIVSGDTAFGSAVQALHLGVWDYVSKPIRDFNLLHKLIEDSLQRRELIQENRRYKEHLEELVSHRTRQLEVKNLELAETLNQVIGVLSRAAEYKDFETGQHFVRVSRYCEILARGYGLDEKKVELIRLASPVHDIGKIGIPESILLKPSRLNEEEIEVIQRHCQFGAEILSSHGLEDLVKRSESDVSTSDADALLDVAARIARYHHERFDGTGYLEGRKGEEIPIEARIAAVADVYDALGTPRPYKKAWSEEECLKYLEEQAGTQFDPGVVEVFLKNYKEILSVKEDFDDSLHETVKLLY
jgi:putative two-component system response regulator